jgi:hypothetical protein
VPEGINSLADTFFEGSVGKREVDLFADLERFLPLCSDEECQETFVLFR